MRSTPGRIPEQHQVWSTHTDAEQWNNLMPARKKHQDPPMAFSALSDMDDERKLIELLKKLLREKQEPVDGNEDADEEVQSAANVARSADYNMDGFDWKN